MRHRIRPRNLPERIEARRLDDEISDLKARLCEETRRADKLEKLTGFEYAYIRDAVKRANDELADLRREIERELNRAKEANASAAEAERAAKLGRELLKIIDSSLGELLLKKEIEVRSLVELNKKLKQRVKHYAFQLVMGVIVSLIAGVILGTLI